MQISILFVTYAKFNAIRSLVNYNLSSSTETIWNLLRYLRDISVKLALSRITQNHIDRPTDGKLGESDNVANVTSQFILEFSIVSVVFL